MRLVALGVALALAGTLPAASATAVAQAPVTTQPLAPGEVLLELNATGSVVTRADSAVLVLLASADGATVQDAIEASRREANRLAGIIRAAAGPGATVEIAAAQSVPDIEASMAAMNAMVPEDMNATMEATTYAETPPRMQANSTITIRLRDLSRMAPLMSALTAAGVSPAGEPVYALADSAAAQREARSRAIASARVNAEAYAQALGLRVVRVVRVTERLGFDFFATMMNEQRMRRQFEENHSPDIETTVTLGIDFALAPR